jgi:hypothetical protein
MKRVTLDEQLTTEETFQKPCIFWDRHCVMGLVPNTLNITAIKPSMNLGGDMYSFTIKCCMCNLEKKEEFKVYHHYPDYDTITKNTKLLLTQYNKVQL